MQGYLPEFWLRRFATVAVISGCIGLSACSTTPQQDDRAFLESALDNNQRFELVVENLNAGEFRNAGLQLQLLEGSSLSPSQQLDWLLLSARVAIGEGDTVLAQSYLDQFSARIDSATPQQEQQAGWLTAAVYEADGQFLQAARERDFISGVLVGDIKQSNQERLWLDLMQIPDGELLTWAEKSPNTRFGGWLQLAAISKSNTYTLDEHLAAIMAWRNANPGHPASMQLPGSLSMLEDIAANRPTRVALLLPLTGRLERTGAAIRDGFMAAYFAALSKGYLVPAITLLDSEQYPAEAPAPQPAFTQNPLLLGDVPVAEPTVTVDAMSVTPPAEVYNLPYNLSRAYADAQRAGAQWLVGPVSKPDVQALQTAPMLPMPTLALNYGDRSDDEGQIPSASLYQFGLAAEDEAVQIAERAWQDGHRRALVMIPEGNWGERIFAAFEQRWLELGGEIGENRFYAPQKDFNPEIKALLNVEDSQQRYKTMRSLLRQSTEFEPRRREDVDWVFLVALPAQARQIKPTLAFNFAADLPVYATSHVFSGAVDPKRDRDLNGIRFCDAPWLLRHTELYNDVEKSVKGGQGSYARLYAMGVDSYRLIARVKQLEAFPESQIFGTTGALTLDDQRRIHRKTECTRFRSGEPVQLAIE